MSETIERYSGDLIYTASDGTKKQLLPTVLTDATLSVSGAPADAGAVGEAINGLDKAINGLTEDINNNAAATDDLVVRIEETYEKAEVAETIAKGKNRGHVFATTTDMQTWLSNSENAGLYQVGDNLYIVEVDVPDWWISEVLTEADSETGYFYKIAQLETQKVDLSEYIKSTEVNTRLGGLSFVKCTQSAYNALSSKPSTTVYFIQG